MSEGFLCKFPQTYEKPDSEYTTSQHLLSYFLQNLLRKDSSISIRGGLYGVYESTYYDLAMQNICISRRVDLNIHNI